MSRKRSNEQDNSDSGLILGDTVIDEQVECTATEVLAEPGTADFTQTPEEVKVEVAEVLAEPGTADFTQTSEEVKVEVAEVSTELEPANLTQTSGEETAKVAEVSVESETSNPPQTPKGAKAEVTEAIDPLQPVNLELLYGDKASNPPEKLTKEKVEASVRKKLAKKTDAEKTDPFVPQSQLDNEVVQVAREKGFPLSRGTEIGARLLARSRRTT